MERLTTPISPTCNCNTPSESKSEMKTTDYTEYTDNDYLVNQGLFIQRVNNVWLDVPRSICAHL